MNSKFILAFNVLTYLTISAFSQGINLNWKKAGSESDGGKLNDIIVYRGDGEGKTLIAATESYGLYKSTNRGATWSKINMGNVSPYISSLYQLPNGTIYIATGKVLDTTSSSTPYNYDKIGNGIWVTTNGGGTFSQIPNTSPNVSLGINDTWAAVNKIYIDANNTNRIIAGTAKGLRITNDNGSTWINPLPNDTNQVLDLKVSGSVVLVAFKRKSMISTDGGNTFNQITGTTPGLLPSSSFYRNEFAIAPNNNNIIYAAIISNTGILSAIYYSTNQGTSWSLFSYASVFNFDPITEGFSSKGVIFEVLPGTTDNLIVAGSKYFSYSPSTGWIKRVSGVGIFNKIEWDPADNSKVYFATSNGAYRSYSGAVNITRNTLTAISAGVAASEINSFSYGSLKGFATTGSGAIIFNKPELGNAIANPIEITGKPVKCFISKDGALFLAQTYGDIQRSSDNGQNWQRTKAFVSDRVATILASSTVSDISNTKTPFDAKEIFTNGGDSKVYLALGTNSSVKITWTKNNKTGVYEPSFTTKTNTSVVWVSTQPNDFSKQAYMMKVASSDKPKPDALTGNPTILKFSADLNYLYVATKQTSTGKTFIYRVANINALKDSLNDIDSSTSQITVNRIADFGTIDVTNLAVDPNNPGVLLVTAKGVGASTYLYRCTNADVAPSSNNMSNFTPLAGNGLPTTSIFDALIDINNPDIALLATNDGLYYSTNFTDPAPSFTKDNNFPNNTPITFEQITSYYQSGEKGRVFVGTLGSGVYTADFSIQVSTKPVKQLNTTTLYPNPSNGQFTINSEKMFNQLKIYDFTGRIIKDKYFNSTNHHLFSDELKSGIYLIEVLSDGEVIKTDKLVITN